MKYFIFLFFINFSFSQSIGRVYNGPAINSSDQNAFNAVNSRGSWRPIVNNFTIDGSPLAFVSGKKKLKVTTADGYKTAVPNGNYNAQTDKIVYTVGIDSIFIFDTSKFIKIQFDNKELNRFKNLDGKSRFYFNVYKSDTNSLYVSYFARIKPGAVNALTKAKVTNDKFVIDKKYFVLNDSIVSEIKIKKNKILKLFVDKKSYISNFIKENNIDFKDENDLIKVFKYYDSL
jgi:hypothetical protein